MKRRYRNGTHEKASTIRTVPAKDVFFSGRVVPQKGFEPPTHALRMRCSTELSYCGTLT